MRLTWFAIALTIINLAILIFIIAQRRTLTVAPSADVVRARVIELVDENGRERASLKVEPSGEVVFRLKGENEAIRVKLGASDAGSGLVLLNEATEPGIQMLADQDGPRIILTGEDGVQQVIKP